MLAILFKISEEDNCFLSSLNQILVIKKVDLLTYNKNNAASPVEQTVANCRKKIECKKVTYVIFLIMVDELGVLPHF